MAGARPRGERKSRLPGGKRGKLRPRRKGVYYFLENAISRSRPRGERESFRKFSLLVTSFLRPAAAIGRVSLIAVRPAAPRDSLQVSRLLEIPISNIPLYKCFLWCFRGGFVVVGKRFW